MFKKDMTVRWSDDYIEGMHTDQERRDLQRQKGVVKQVDKTNKTATVLWFTRTQAVEQVCRFQELKRY